MTGTPNRPPLWREIDCAWWSLVDTANPHAAPPENDQAACVIRCDVIAADANDQLPTSQEH